MSILIDLRDTTWMEDKHLKNLIAPQLPGIKIYCGKPNKIMNSIKMIVIISFYNEYLKYLPNLSLIQKAGAGVDTILKNKNIPDHIKVCRMSSTIQADEISDYCLANVLAFQHNLPFYRFQQDNNKWSPSPIITKETTVVGILGLGQIGSKTASLFYKMGFKVCGWSKSKKNIQGVATFCGLNGFKNVLRQSHYIIGILPETPETINLIDKKTLSFFRNESVFINVGRGSLVVENELTSALDSGKLKGAVLDVTQVEPLPRSHPFWPHPKITITPHISGWNVNDGYNEIAQNYLKITSDQPIKNQINRNKGY